MEARERGVLYYQDQSKELPFRDWRNGFSDIKAKAAIDAKIAKMRVGNLGDSRTVGGGVLEAEIDLGPGYRIYFGIHGDQIILLCGGDKRTQSSDIETAKKLWTDFKERTRPKGG